MKKYILPIIALAMMVFLGACSNSYVDEIEDNTATTPEVGRTVTITASVPGDDNPTTRVTLVKNSDGKTINLTWEANDPLALAIVQGANKWAVTGEVTTITNNGKRANFTFTLPDATSGFDKNAAFDFYGVYGGGGISVTGTSITAILPANPGNATSLTSVQSRKDVMLYFKSEGYKLSAPTTVQFQHLGFLFSIKLKNTGATDLLMGSATKKISLVGNDNTQWAYNGTGGQINLKTNAFSYISGANNNFGYIPFTIGSQLKKGETYEFWGWSTLTGVAWPALNLAVNWKKDGADNSPLLTSTTLTPKAARTPEIGKTYYIFAEVNGVANTSVTVKFVPRF